MKLNITNFRDVSDYVNKDGKRMKKNLIFRGARLNQLTKEEIQYMEEVLNIQYILDYRDDTEASLNPDPIFTKAVNLRIPALQIKTKKKEEGFDFGEMLGKAMTPVHLKMMSDYLQEGYRYMPFDNPAYHKLFECLLKGGGGIYFHCSAGKDRTGVSAFLIMMALGMKEEDAIKEYLLSNEYLHDINEAFYQAHPVPLELRKYTDCLLYVPEENIRTAITAIKEKYSSYEAFLEKEYGLDETKRNQLIEIYCE